MEQIIFAQYHEQQVKQQAYFKVIIESQAYLIDQETVYIIPITLVTVVTDLLVMERCCGKLFQTGLQLHAHAVALRLKTKIRNMHD